MISPACVQLMASYNAWQNRSLYGAGDTLSDAARKQDRGAFFGSIHKTLNHLLWADQMWLHRFAAAPPPGPAGIAASVDYHSDWALLKADRWAFDDVIKNWATDIDEAWLASDVTWFSGSAQKDVTKPAWLLVAHVFNHQTHHRGQVHAMLTAAGARPDDTDIPFMPE